jgi:hypothetical protein
LLQYDGNINSNAAYNAEDDRLLSNVVLLSGRQPITRVCQAQTWTMQLNRDDCPQPKLTVQGDSSRDPRVISLCLRRFVAVLRHRVHLVIQYRASGLDSRLSTARRSDPLAARADEHVQHDASRPSSAQAKNVSKVIS